MEPELAAHGRGRRGGGPGLSTRVGPFLLLLLLGTGCPSASTLQTVRTLPPSKLRLAVGMDVVSLRGPALVGDATESGRLTLPQLEVAGRMGLSDRLDVGAKLFLVGALFDVKWQFLKTHRVDAAVAPGLGWTLLSGPATTSGAAVNSLDLHLPFLFGFNVSDDITLMLGPRVLGRLSFSPSGAGVMQARLLPFIGGSAGVALQLGDSLVLLPEVTLLNVPGEVQGVVVHGGLGLMFGGGRTAGVAREPDSLPPELPLGDGRDSP